MTKPFFSTKNLCSDHFGLLLQKCMKAKTLQPGRQVHAMLVTTGTEINTVSLNSKLVGVYASCGDVRSARLVLAKTGNPNVFALNWMISASAFHGFCEEAVGMSRERLVPDLVTWNAMISGFAQSHRAVEAMKLFQDMLVAGIRPNHVTVTGLLPVCGLMGSIRRGKEIQCLIYRMGFDANVFVASALIDMYSKCGSVKDAKNVFDQIPAKNVASWNAMIGCYGKHSMVDSSIQLFERMQEEGIWANQVTLISVLSACSHGGLVEKGELGGGLTLKVPDFIFSDSLGSQKNGRKERKILKRREIEIIA
ncbi:hypothetical protein L1049_017809 [Liquidambar formosana]|uniref:Pentatricopeptide repeat-containing protein n=1 Tax=Liquidambar formosana TaxID=63359 RepID=A0AAP0NGM7_LIQFO